MRGRKKAALAELPGDSLEEAAWGPIVPKCIQKHWLRLNIIKHHPQMEINLTSMRISRQVKSISYLQ